MRILRRSATLTGLAAALTLCLILSGCQESNTVAGPAAGSPEVPSVNLAGTWTGTFQPDSGSCGATTVRATFTQEGASVRGNLATEACGLSGLFQASVEGYTLRGSFAMAGCTGGALSGSATASEMSFTLADLTKDLVTGQDTVLPGGIMTLRR
jgi:hypothetical protein